MTVEYLTGDCREVLKKLPEKHFNTVVTSPPYYGLRDYGTEEQFGLEDTPEAFVKNLVEVFKEIKRVLRDDGTVWLNLGDTYSSNRWSNTPSSTGISKFYSDISHKKQTNLEDKNLIGVPWKVAFALQKDGWYLRQDVIWHKPNAMPESVKDRCTKAHEYIFLFSKNKSYYFDNEAIKEEVKHDLNETKNKRSVWTVSFEPFKKAHFAVFPTKLIEPCVLAGCPKGGHVLDPFGGSGTTGLVADRFNRNATLIDLNEDYIEIAKKRIKDDAPLLVGWANE